MKNKHNVKEKIKASRTAKGAKQFFADFKSFIKKGNVLDLSVAVIIGAAFTAIVTSLTKDIIMPLITALFSACGVKGGLDGMSVVLNGVPSLVLDSTTGTMVANPEAILWNYGRFIQAIIDFILIAFVVFLIVRTLQLAKKKSMQAVEQMEKLKEKIKERNNEDEENAAPLTDENAEMQDNTPEKEVAQNNTPAPEVAPTPEVTPILDAAAKAAENGNEEIVALLREIKTLLEKDKAN